MLIEVTSQCLSSMPVILRPLFSFPAGVRQPLLVQSDAADCQEKARLRATMAVAIHPALSLLRACCFLFGLQFDLNQGFRYSGQGHTLLGLSNCHGAKFGTHRCFGCEFLNPRLARFRVDTSIRVRRVTMHVVCCQGFGIRYSRGTMPFKEVLASFLWQGWTTRAPGIRGKIAMDIP